MTWGMERKSVSKKAAARGLRDHALSGGSVRYRGSNMGQMVAEDERVRLMRQSCWNASVFRRPEDLLTAYEGGDLG